MRYHFTSPANQYEKGCVMCLSETVSFAASGLLLVGGAYACTRAWTTNKKYLPVAMMPIFAGLQQFSEGFVWSGMNNGDPSLTLISALVFIFFTWFMWPFWIPLSVYVLEPPESKRKHLFLAFALIGLAFGLILYVPHLLNPDWINVSINRDSLAYEGTMLLDFMMPRTATNTLYLTLIVIPPLLSRYLHVRFFGLSLIAVIVVDILFLRYAYISFFCLLAGLATLHLIYIIVRNKCQRECPMLFS
ncbi:MAG: hypothetical protein L3J32_11160 [Rhizobiaceae bacterium]|nr:hypothetical protein [Rhizobiaceae bacterium]